MLHLGGGVTPWVMFQGTAEVLTCMGSDTSPLGHHMDGRLALADYLRTSVWGCLAAVPSADKALRNLGTFAFVAVHLLSAERRHAAAVMELLCLIERLENLHI